MRSLSSQGTFQDGGEDLLDNGLVRPLTLDNLQGGFILLAIGWGLGFMALLVEFFGGRTKGIILWTH